jgi:hypothetical protein
LTQLCHHTKNFSKREAFSLFSDFMARLGDPIESALDPLSFPTSAEASSQPVLQSPKKSRIMSRPTSKR